MAADVPARPWTPAEVAIAFGVDPKTVTRWANKGKMKCIITPGGHRRFPDDVVRKALEEGPPPRG